MVARPRLRAVVVVPIALAVSAVLAVGLYLFQPWQLFVDVTVNESSPLTGAAAPSGATPPSSSTEPSSGSEPSSSVSAPTSTPVPLPGPATSEPSGPVVVATGTFISHEHQTDGEAALIRLADGSHVLRIEGLDTSNGPDLKVWLSDAAVIEGTDGWHVFDDGDYVDLGSLKGNKGDQNYAVPSDADLDDLTSVSVWCARFKVSFGAASLTPVRA